MKKLKEVIEVENEGFVSLLGETITLFCANYIYTGKLESVNESCVKISSAKVVYETGPFDEPDWEDAQALPHPVFIQMGLVESYTKLK